MNDHMLESVVDGVATLTLNRPDSLNALSGEMLDGLLEALPRLSADPSIGCVVITGAGRGFCAGGDVKGMAAGEGGPQGLEAKSQDLRRKMETSRLLHDMPKPTIAAVRGPMAGAGMSLALACDMRIASDTLKFTTAFRNVGFSGDFGGTYFLTQLVGTAKARELYFTAEKLNASQALDLGIVNRIVADDALETEVAAFAKSVADGPRIGLGYMKMNLNLAEQGQLADCLDREALHMVRCGETEDHQEAAQAFVEKRAPVFKGR